jgi:hypothetical protein
LSLNYQDIRGQAVRILAMGSGLLALSVFAGATLSKYFFGFLPVILSVTRVYIVNAVRCPDCRYRVLKGRFPLPAPEVCPQCGARPGEAIDAR